MSAAQLGFLAAILAIGALVLWFRWLQQVSLGGRRWLLYGALGAAILLGGLAIARGPGWLGGIAAGFAVLAGAAWSLLGLLARQSTQVPSVAVGEPLPAFSAPDHNGELFQSASLAGRPALIKLFRGHW